MKNMNTKDKCICCGKQAEWLRVTTLPSFLFNISAKIVKCSVCGFAKTIPTPEVEDAFYEDNIRYEDLFIKDADLYRGFARKLLSTLDGLIEPDGKRLLDVASGGGFVVEVAQELGFTAQGLDANARVVKWCQKRGLNVRNDDVTKLSNVGEDLYDVIILSAIIEHLPNPEDLILSCKSLLKPGGVILVHQAIYDGLLPRFFPWGWYGWQPKEHFWHFTPNSLQKLFEHLGLRVIYTVRDSCYHPWFIKGSIKELVGRNIAACIARVGEKCNQGDSFNLVVTS